MFWRLSMVISAVSDTTNENPLATPQFVREREAWYKAGAGTMAAFAAIAVLLVGVIVGIASLLFPVDRYQIAMGIVVGTWGCIAVINFCMDISARGVANRGGVQVDRF